MTQVCLIRTHSTWYETSRLLNLGNLTIHVPFPLTPFPLRPLRPFLLQKAFFIFSETSASNAMRWRQVSSQYQSRYLDLALWYLNRERAMLFYEVIGAWLYSCVSHFDASCSPWPVGFVIFLPFVIKLPQAYVGWKTSCMFAHRIMHSIWREVGI